METKVEKRTFAEVGGLPTDRKITADELVAKVNEIHERIAYLCKRDGTVDPDIQRQMADDIKTMQAQLVETDKIAKAAGRSGGATDFDAMEPLLLAEHIVPDEKRTSPAYYVLASLSPDELRYGAAYRSLDNSPVQRIARAVESVSERAIRDFHRANDQLYIADLVMTGNGRTAYARSSTDPVERMKRGCPKAWKEWERTVGQFERLGMTTSTAAAGGAWIPTQLSQRLAELIQPELQVAGLFEVVDMPNKIFDYPLFGADPVAFKVPETGSIGQQDIATAKVTFTATKLGLRVVASTEVIEDAAIALEPRIMQKIAAGTGRGIEDSIINGDSLITAGGTGAQDFDLQQAQNSGYATDRRGSWDGLRKFSLVSGMPNKDISTFNIENLLGIRAAMKGGSGGNMFGLFARDLVWLVNLVGYIKILTLSQASQASAVLTIEKYGPGATIMTGEVAQIAGSPVILSEFVRDDVASTGVNTTGGPNTLSTLQLFNRTAFALGRRRDITVQRSSEHRFDTDEIEYTGTWRGHWRDLYPVGAGSANRSVGVGRNFS
jgi:hypothetical protein